MSNQMSIGPTATSPSINSDNSGTMETQNPSVLPARRFLQGDTEGKVMLGAGILFALAAVAMIIVLVLVVKNAPKPEYSPTTHWLINPGAVDVASYKIIGATLGLGSAVFLSGMLLYLAFQRNAKAQARMQHS